MVETGKARYTARDFAFMGEASQKAAEAAEAAADQGKFWEYRELLFKNQGLLRGATTETYVAWAGQVGMDQAKFQEALTSGKHAQFVKDEAQAAQRMGIPGTPALMVDGQLIKGASGGNPTNEELAAAVERAAQNK